MTNKNILIFQTGEPTHLDEHATPMRLMNLTDILLKNDYKIYALVPRFSHQEKKFRSKKILDNNKEKKINYIFLESTGYKNNISFKRLFDHLVLAKNLYKKLKEIDNIDYVFMGYPPIEACFVLSRWCVNNKIPYIVDYKDLWPELFTVNMNIIFKILSFPIIFILKLARNFIIKNSSGISTISENFLDNLNLDNIQQKKIVCYLTKKKSSDLNLKNINDNIHIKFSSKKIRIVFIGNFMVDAFDFKILKEIEHFIKNSSVLEMHFFGSGPSKSEIESILNFNNIFIWNRVNSFEFQYIMQNSQAVFLPLKNRFDYLKSIPNKVVDAIQHKVPIFTCQKGQTEFLIKKYNLGFVYEDSKSLLNQLKWFCKNKNYDLIKKNYDNLEIDVKFNHDLNYKKIIDKIEFDLEQKIN